jgi:A/G-specific adenine glycosylase
MHLPQALDQRHHSRSTAGVTRVERIKGELLVWYEGARRTLPWRETKDPYKVWISEIMLQQTRVETVLPYYARFIEKWPDLLAFAKADDETVRASWSGLGYYRRAKLMRQAARCLIDDHGGRWPQSAQELQKLPGIGRYTAGAVASIAFDEPVAAVDGNVLRVLARIQGLAGDVTKGPVNKKVWDFCHKLAQTKLEASDPYNAGDFTQSLIELGALLCTPKSPNCESCPLRPECKAHAQNRQDQIPPPRTRPKRTPVHLTAIVSNRGQNIVLEQRPSTGIFADLWCLPLLEGDLEPDAALDEMLRRWNWEGDHAQVLGHIKHVLTHRDVMVRLVHVQSSPTLPKGFIRLDLDQLGEFGIPSITSKLLEAGLPDEVLAGVILPGRKTIKRASSHKVQRTLLE